MSTQLYHGGRQARHSPAPGPRRARTPHSYEQDSTFFLEHPKALHNIFTRVCSFPGKGGKGQFSGWPGNLQLSRDMGAAEHGRQDLSEASVGVQSRGLSCSVHHGKSYWGKQGRNAEGRAWIIFLLLCQENHFSSLVCSQVKS